MADQGLFFYSGVQSFISARIAFSHGISPSVATVTIAPQSPGVSQYGTMIWKFGNTTFNFIECKADYGSAQFDENGELWQFAILDRRWKWRYGAISGQWNVRRDDFTINPETEQTPQELARYCLIMMGEDTWNVGDLPNDSRPSVNWDYTNPAEALAQLCDSLGCYIVPNLYARTGKICVAGQGNNLPDGGYVMDAVTADLPEMPDFIGVLCGPSIFQHTFDISEACGVESNSSRAIKKLDDLNCKPKNGWSKSDPIRHGDIANRVDREHACQSVWHYYRV